MFSSVMSCAINGSAYFLPTLVVGFVLDGIHQVLARMAYHVDRLAQLVKGS